MEPPKPILAVRDLIRSIVARIQWLPPLAARLILGVVFVQTGWGKLHDLAGTTENFRGWHIPFPHLNAILAAGTEFGGGCLLLAGLGTRFAGVGIMVVMAVAIASAKWSKIEDWTDFFGFDELAYAVMALWLAARGAGKASLDYLIGKRLGLLVDGRDRDRSG
jgi:putative oxidoreductase